jgi:flagellar biosynthetic protein FliS
MNEYQNTEREYQISAIQDASSARLVVIMYDILTKDVVALESGMTSMNFEAQTRAVKHALLVLLQLEGSLNMEDGGACAASLAQYYQTIRALLLQAQAGQSRETTALVLKLIGEVRAAWEHVDSSQNRGQALRDSRKETVLNSWSG